MPGIGRFVEEALGCLRVTCWIEHELYWRLGLIDFREVTKTVVTGSQAQREIKDYFLSRVACYLIGQHGYPRKPEIEAAQLYFAVSTRQNELHKLYKEQQKRLELRERVSQNNLKVEEADHGQECCHVASASFTMPDIAEGHMVWFVSHSLVYNSACQSPLTRIC